MKRERRHLPLHLYLPVVDLHLAVDDHVPPPLHHLLTRLQGHRDGCTTVGHQLLAVHHELERLSLGAKGEVAGEGGEVRGDRGGIGEGETKMGVKCVLGGQVLPS